MLGRRELLERIDALIEDTRREVDEIDIDSDLLSDSNASYIDADLTDDSGIDSHASPNAPSGAASSQPVQATQDVVKGEGPTFSSVAALQVFIHAFLPTNLEALKEETDERSVCIGVRFLDFGTILISCKGVRSNGTLKFECGKSCLLQSVDMTQIRGEAKLLPMYVMLLQRGTKDAETFRLLSSTALDVSEALEHHDRWHSGTYDCFDLLGRVNGSVRMRMRFTNYGSSLLPHINSSSNSEELHSVESTAQQDQVVERSKESRTLSEEACNFEQVSRATGAQTNLADVTNAITRCTEDTRSSDEGSFSLVKPNETYTRQATSLVAKAPLDAPPPLYFKNWPIDYEDDKRPNQIKSSQTPRRLTTEVGLNAATRKLPKSAPSKWKVKKTRTQRIREEAARKRLENAEPTMLHRSSSYRKTAKSSSCKGKKKAKQRKEETTNEDFLQVFDSIDQANARYNLHQAGLMNNSVNP